MNWIIMLPLIAMATAIAAIPALYDSGSVGGGDH
jgi:hypothetical protein